MSLPLMMESVAYGGDDVLDLAAAGREAMLLVTGPARVTVEGGVCVVAKVRHENVETVDEARVSRLDHVDHVLADHKLVVDTVAMTVKSGEQRAFCSVGGGARVTVERS